MKYEICHDVPAYIRYMKLYAIFYFFDMSRMVSLRQILAVKTSYTASATFHLVFGYQTRETPGRQK
jgi:hypothetical protein